VFEWAAIGVVVPAEDGAEPVKNVF
jgi:hypothetical protein